MVEAIKNSSFVSSTGDDGLNLKYCKVKLLDCSFESNKAEWKNIYKYEADQDESYKNEWLHFIECIKNKDCPNVSFQDGLKVLDIIDSIRIASSSGKKVKVK